MASSKLDRLLAHKRGKRKSLKVHSKKLKVISPFQPGLIKIKNLPFGFFENEMKEFFSQFGKVTDVLVARHRKSSKVKNFGYVKFAHLEVAKIAAKTMNNYLMFDNILKCKVINSIKKFNLLMSKRNELKISTRHKHKQMVNKDKTTEKEKQLIKRKIAKIRSTEKKLEELEINFKCKILLDE